jgi:hypothetical protein
MRHNVADLAGDYRDQCGYTVWLSTGHPWAEDQLSHM